jgi:hypothetical protein
MDEIPFPPPSGYLSSPVGFGEETESSPRHPLPRKRPYAAIADATENRRIVRRAIRPTLPSSSPSIIDVTDSEDTPSGVTTDVDSSSQVICLDSSPSPMHTVGQPGPSTSRSNQIAILMSPDSSPAPSIGSSLQEDARQAIGRALGRYTAMEKSPAQLEAIIRCLFSNDDMCVIIPTGGGKTLIWEAVGLKTGELAIIMVPFRQLLQQHLESSTRKGIVSVHWLASNPVLPPDVQHIFVQPETVRSQKFKQ